jgi:hypothetical protein
MMKKRICFLMLAFLYTAVYAQQPPANYDESKIPPYTLPDPLLTLQGKTVTTAEEWMTLRRPEIISLFEQHIYGRVPGTIPIYSIVPISREPVFGNAIRKQLNLNFKQNGHELHLRILMYLPVSTRDVPVFVGYNFNGNHTVSTDPGILITDSWVANDSSFGIYQHKSTELSRGSQKERWQVEKILAAGYGLVTLCYSDVDPDRNDFSDGVHPLLYKPGQAKPLPDEWGAISAWAWGLSRVMDYLEQDPDVDVSRVAVMGHSRLGKTALWAGALDQRFALVISNNSGCGGAALSRRIYGERLGGMNQYFAHWFCDNCSQYDDKEETLPVDQHMLIALIAPRPVYIASALEDQWADPKGEYLSGFYAGPVYRLFGKTGLPSGEMPGISQPVMNTIGYHIRPGVHGVFAYDWDQFIRFANLQLKAMPASR